MFFRDKPSDNERRWRRFELRECSLVKRVIYISDYDLLRVTCMCEIVAGKEADRVYVGADRVAVHS